MPADFIPRADGRFLLFAENFARTLVAHPWRYGVAPAAAAYVQQLVDEFAQKLATSTREATATKGATIEKNSSRYSAEWIIRSYARLIKRNLGVSDADKIGLGVPPINISRRRIGAPETWPLLNVQLGTYRRHHMTYTDCASGSKGKPHGVVQLQLFRAVTNRRHAALSEAKYYGVVTDNPIVVDFETADSGKIATYYARWATERGKTGPWSLPVSFGIAA